MKIETMPDFYIIITGQPHLKIFPSYVQYCKMCSYEIVRAVYCSSIMVLCLLII